MIEITDYTKTVNLTVLSRHQIKFSFYICEIDGINVKVFE